VDELRIAYRLPESVIRESIDGIRKLRDFSAVPFARRILPGVRWA
jgi:hypothetical protein